jgi:hypothetical protein
MEAWTPTTTKFKKKNKKKKNFDVVKSFLSTNSCSFCNNVLLHSEAETVDSLYYNDNNDLLQLNLSSKSDCYKLVIVIQ